MAFSVNYKELFSISIYHDYFLDNGLSKFKNMNADLRDEQLQATDYNWSEFFEIVPAQSAVTDMKNHRMVIVRENDVFRVMTAMENSASEKPFIPISPDLELTFLVKVKAPHFFNYTPLSFSSQRLYWLTNNLPSSDEEPPHKCATAVPLIPVYNTTMDAAITGKFLAGEQCTKYLQEELGLENTPGVAAVISVRMRVASEEHCILSAIGGRIKGTRFLLRFENSSYIWKYVERKSKEAYYTIQPYPLVKNGYIEMKGADLTPVLNSQDRLLPNPGLDTFENSGETIYSVIFI